MNYMNSVALLSVSQNDLPEFDKDQLYAVFEFEYHGTDIESYKFRNARQSLAVYLHVSPEIGKIRVNELKATSCR